jgi:carbon-monoxide dehydrogenase medium subunit/2-furoyl-CoA dehydrogenase FAD binding subunit
MRLSTPEYLIDVGRLDELRYIREEDGYIAIGALTRHADVEKSPLVKARCPLLAEAVRWIGHMQIRNRGTVGGSIAHADPSAELPCVLAALRGEIVVASTGGEEVVRPDEFFLTYLMTSLQPDQMVKEVRFPVLSPDCGSAFVELARRHGDFALVEVAAVLEMEAGHISSARIAVGGAGPVPCVMEAAEQYLIGKEPADEVWKEAGEMAAEAVEPDSDIHGSAEYRRELANVMTQRALRLAAVRAMGGSGTWAN